MTDAKLSALVSASSFGAQDYLYGVVGGYSRKLTRAVYEGSLGRINAADFGVNGDGTDATAALQAALDTAGCGTVMLPPGICRCGPLNVGRASLIGGGVAATTLLFTGSGYALTVGDLDAGIGLHPMTGGQRLQGFAINGVDAEPGADGICLTGLADYILEQVSIYNFGDGVGIALKNNTWGGELRSVSSTANDIGLHIYRDHASTGVNCIQVVGGTYGNNRIGILIGRELPDASRRIVGEPLNFWACRLGDNLEFSIRITEGNLTNLINVYHETHPDKAPIGISIDYPYDDYPGCLAVHNCYFTEYQYAVDAVRVANLHVTGCKFNNRDIVAPVGVRVHTAGVGASVIEHNILGPDVTEIEMV